MNAPTPLCVLYKRTGVVVHQVENDFDKLSLTPMFDISNHVVKGAASSGGGKPIVSDSHSGML